jgi:predicted methyltransferase
MSSAHDKHNQLRQVADATNLREGPAGVEAMLRAIKRLGPGPINRIAREVRLPIPVATAVRRELEALGLLERRSGVSLTEAGARLVEELFGHLATAVDVSCDACGGLGISPLPPELVAAFAARLERAPSVDVALDQAPCTAETALRRAALMYRGGALEAREILVLGDDDSVAVAIGLFAKSLFAQPMRLRVTVLEIDERRVSFLEQCAREDGLPIEVIRHDLREPLPDRLRGRFDVMQTDPPYTPQGARLFLRRAREGLKNETGTLGYLSYAQRSGHDQIELMHEILEAGFAITAMHPAFNRYVGASILGSVGQLIELAGVPMAAEPSAAYDGPLYTRDINRRMPRYRCRNCGAEVTLGSDGSPATIEQLKQSGCPSCGKSDFNRLSQGSEKLKLGRPKSGS